MLPRLKVFRPIKRNYISQRFGVKGTLPSMLSAYKSIHLMAHNGIDFAVRYKPLYWNCNVKGYVYKISTDSKGGIGLDIISHTKEGYYKHRFWHLKAGSILVKEGDVVDSGQILAITGNTGWSTGPHLHYGLKPVIRDIDNVYHNKFQGNGYYGAIDPEPFFTNIFILNLIKVLLEKILSLAKNILRLQRSTK